MARRITLTRHRLWIIIHQVYDLITRYEEIELKERIITRERFLALWLMKFMSAIDDNPIKVTTLAPSLYRSVNGTSALVDRMEQIGLIKKIRDIPDKRAIRLVITPKGEEAVETGLKSQELLIKRILAIFTEEEVKTLLSMLRKLKTKLREEAGIKEAKVDPEVSNPRKIANSKK